jgi:hypothetical protein
MANIPSRTRSLAFDAFSDRLDLKDAYRILYPNVREFTYIPNANLNINRLRLDFFMISTALAVQKFSTGIGSALSSKSFDHKKIFFELGKKNPKNLNKIDDQITKNVETDIVVRTTVLECYLVHTDTDAFPRYRVNELLLEIGRIRYKLQSHIRLRKSNINNGPVNNELIGEALAILETMPDLEFFDELPLTCEDDFFFEGLVMALKTNVLSLQQDIHNIKNNLLNQKKT